MKKEEVVPGTVIEVLSTCAPGYPNHEGLMAWRDHETIGFGGILIVPGTIVTVLSRPRRVGGINLVRVDADGVECEAYYCDVKSNKLVSIPAHVLAPAPKPKRKITMAKEGFYRCRYGSKRLSYSSGTTKGNYWFDPATDPSGVGKWWDLAWQCATQKTMDRDFVFLSTKCPTPHWDPSKQGKEE